MSVDMWVCYSMPPLKGLGWAICFAVHMLKITGLSQHAELSELSHAEQAKQ